MAGLLTSTAQTPFSEEGGRTASFCNTNSKKSTTNFFCCCPEQRWRRCSYQTPVKKPRAYWLGPLTRRMAIGWAACGDGSGTVQRLLGEGRGEEEEGELRSEE
ncbi:Hypothetical predicted protein [Podarcis lilfordi]|uniref:Uncharacterized protein n=1 Tax=Podarcis lilfordi TaxID=74358 RepID=A0AA35L708_9SAUR|nr:Hypothetical predicted protein [Podarcis lilfordi]